MFVVFKNVEMPPVLFVQEIVSDSDFYCLTSLALQWFWINFDNPFDSLAENVEILLVMFVQNIWEVDKCFQMMLSANLPYTKAPQNALMFMVHLRKGSGRLVIYK